MQYYGSSLLSSSNLDLYLAPAPWCINYSPYLSMCWCVPGQDRRTVITVIGLLLLSLVAREFYIMMNLAGDGQGGRVVMIIS